MRIVYRDEHLLAVDKPSGLAVHRGWVDDADTAVDRARVIANTQVFPAHRLDRGTSGVLLFALSSKVAARLGEIFTANEAQKTYRAIVRGHPPVEGLVDHPVRRGEERDSPRVPARTAFTRLSTCEHPREGERPLRYAWIEARPETGRLHQIRRHMKHLSHPIVGDVRYGKREHNHLCRERFGLARLALHACTLSLIHPVTGVSLLFESPLPDDLGLPLAAMGLLI